VPHALDVLLRQVDVRRRVAKQTAQLDRLGCCVSNKVDGRRESQRMKKEEEYILI
jgi:hypothetical protein